MDEFHVPEHIRECKLFYSINVGGYSCVYFWDEESPLTLEQVPEALRFKADMLEEAVSGLSEGGAGE